MNIKEYQEYVKNSRVGFFSTPFELVYESFEKLGYTEKNADFFIENASVVVESLREECWNSYVPTEKNFVSQMLTKLVDEDRIKDFSPKDAVIWFAETYPDHIYQLSLSNTQSRRSRAGKEFEAIIELIMIACNIPMDSQGNIGKKVFTERGLGKLVDVVSPGVTEYAIDKNDVVLISAKTTLRERWQEVPEEMGRTGAKEMFLATLDENISDDVLDTLYESNIRITTTRNNKLKNYPNNKRVLDFEKLIEICLKNNDQWCDYIYSVEDKKAIKNTILLQIEKHRNHAYLNDYYQKRLDELV